MTSRTMLCRSCPSTEGSPLEAQDLKDEVGDLGCDRCGRIRMQARGVSVVVAGKEAKV